MTQSSQARLKYQEISKELEKAKTGNEKMMRRLNKAAHPSPKVAPLASIENRMPEQGKGGQTPSKKVLHFSRENLAPAATGVVGTGEQDGVPECSQQ